MAAGGSQQEHQEQCNGGRRVARRVAAGTSGTSGTDLEQSNGGRRVATRTAEEHQERRQNQEQSNGGRRVATGTSGTV